MRGTVVLLLTLAAVCSAARPASAATRPYVTALSDYGIANNEYPTFLARARSAGATAIRLDISWASTVAGSTPNAADQTDPAYRGYNWTPADRKIVAIAAHHLIPIVGIASAPGWAQRPLPPDSTPAPGGGSNVDPAAYARFARAVATRYSGSFQSLPRVRYWVAWNEPNISLFLGPQFVGGQPYSPGLYRSMLNAFYAAMKAVAPDNVVIGGETAPFWDKTAAVMKINGDWGPMTFMRNVLCLSKALKPTCSTVVRFDVWSVHPYTSGGPLHKALKPDDVSLGDLGKVKAALNAAVAARHVQAAGGKPQFWISEFGWDSKPPDPEGVPVALLERWIPEAMWRSWRAGVSELTWLQLADLPLTTSFNQGGLYFGGASLAKDRAKRILQAFRFPFVAFPSGRAHVSVWGRTPAGVQARVIVEQKLGSGWKRLRVLVSDRNGIVQARLATKPVGLVRGTLLGTGRSIPFSLKAVPDQFFNPFGLPGLESPAKKAFAAIEAFRHR